MPFIQPRRVFLLSVIAARSFSKSLQSKELFQDAKLSQDSDGQKVYESGGEITAPKLLHYVEPEFSPSSKEAYVEGTVKITTVVTTEGKPRNSKVISGLSAEEDRTALEALKQWTFRPGTRSGKPVNVRVNVQIDFHLL